MVDKPVPYPTPDTEPYWAAARERELRVPRCADCGRLVWYPRAYCPGCMSGDLRWELMSGRGTLVSWVVNQRPGIGYQADVPYPLALVELVEGPRLTTNIVDTPLDRLAIDAAVEVVFEERGSYLVPQFRVLGGAA